MQQHSPSRRKRGDHHEEGGHAMAHDESNWLVSYADMMTLLFGFFVLMYSFSKVDDQKFEIVRKDLVKYFGGKMQESPGASNLKKQIESELAKSASTLGFSEQFNVQSANNMVQLNFDSELVFNPGSAELTPESAKMVDGLASQLKKFNIEQVEVEGHSDIDAINSPTFPSNWELSSARSSRIVRRLIENGLSEESFTAIGYGASRPSVPHKNERGEPIVENKAKNRRVVINIALKPDGALSLAEIEKVGFRTINSENIETEDDRLKKELAQKNDDLKTKLQDAQKRYQEMTAKLKEAQELEKSVREMESIAKKTAEIERKVQSLNERTAAKLPEATGSETKAKDPNEK